MASTMQLEFSQAMSDFKTMFPDMDREVIEAVLRANQGAVDQTIDQLLAMSTDNQNEKLRNELDANGSPQRTLINLNDTNSAQLIDTTDGASSQTVNSTTPNNTMGVAGAAGCATNTNLLGIGSNTGASSSPHHSTGASPKQRPPQTQIVSCLKTTLPSGSAGTTPKKTLTFTNTSSRWQPPILGPLPHGFLRITPANNQHEFDLPDEQFALMLQNEEFMNQLRWNQEFMNALEKEQAGKAKAEDDAAFKERLKNMGKLSRKKFLQMARVFTWQRNKKVTTAKQIDSLPLKEEPSDDEEVQHQRHHQEQHHSSNQQTNQQLHDQPQIRK